MREYNSKTMAKKSKKNSKWSYPRRQQATAAIQARWNKLNGKTKEIIF